MKPNGFMAETVATLDAMFLVAGVVIVWMCMVLFSDSY